MKYIELNRRLRVLTNEEHDKRAYLEMVEHPHLIKGDPWDDVLKSRLVVVLAEAGSGKTEELRNQCEKLRTAGRRAWFVPIERLSGDKLLDLLSEEPGERESFEAWLANGTVGEATLFLDAVDELKLVHGNLATALGRVVSASGAERRRLRIVLSCRPSDWQPGADRELLIRRFPQPVQQDEVLERSPDEEFRLGLAGLRAKREKAEDAAPDLQVAVLLPLDADQIRTVARSLGVTDVNAFLKEIDQRDAWIFTRRPLDLIEVIQVWNAKARLGTRLEQHAANVDISLKDRPNRPDGNLLSPEHARLGAQRLALALFRIGARTLRAPEHTLTSDRSGDAVSAGDILTDWPDDRVNALLRRPIFDPATYGRVKFHHRSTQEYLAALELKRLLEMGLPIRQVLDLLTADTYGEEILAPSLRPLSAWLALWDQHICKAVLAREPEVLLQYGDPESLPPAAQIELLRSFVAHYGGGSWRGLEIPAGEIKRLASPPLADEIRTLWATHPKNEEARSFLVKLIWLGGIAACYDLAEEAALSNAENQTVRILGVRSLGLENGARLRSVVADILQNSWRWPARVVQNSAAEIWKAGPAVNDFVDLVAATPEPSNVTSGFGWSLFNLATELDPSDPRVAELAHGLTRLIRGGRTPSDWFHVSSRLSYLAPALGRLAEKLLKNSPAADQFVEGAVVAVRFSHRNTLGRDENMGLKQLIQGRIEWRRQAFWAEIALYTERDEAELRPENSYVVLHDSVLGDLEAQDWDWLLTDLQAANVPETRAFLCEQLIHLWWRCGERPEQRAQLLWAVADDAALSERAASQTIRHPPDPALAEMDRERVDWEAQRAAGAKKHEEEWAGWREELLADPAGALSGEKKGWHAHNLLNWVEKTTERDNKIAIVKLDGVRRAFSDQVFDLLLAFLADYWRNNDPPVLSKRPPEKHGSITTGTTWALTGLGWESTINPAWTDGLSEIEARRAAGWATLELNGFPDWLSVLVVPHAGVVRETLLAELDGEIANVETVVHPRMIADLRQAPEVLRSLLHTDLVDRLEELSLPAEGAASGHAVSNLAQLIGVAAQEGEGTPDARIAALCSARFGAAPLGPFALVWLTGCCQTNGNLSPLGRKAPHPGRNYPATARHSARAAERRSL